MKTILKITAICLMFCAFVAMRTPVKTIKPTIIQSDSTAALFDYGTKPQLISKQFSFTEGASVDKKGNVFFTDQPNDKIWEYDTDGKLSVFLEKTGRANGTYFDSKGNLIVCADEKNQLLSISPKREIKVLLKDHEGRLLNGPNDIWVAPDGGIFITDPFYKRDYWPRTRGMEQNGQKVYYLAKNSEKAIPVTNDLRQPNGIVGTPDGKYLYVADIGASKIYKYKIGKDGILTEKTLFAGMGSDGMTLDNKGNLYLTGKGVTIYNPQGKRIAQIPINEEWTANLCFGGKNKDVLFITAFQAIYTLKMKVKGVE